MPTHEVLIIGAGPTGLAMAGRLTKRGVPYHIIEKSEHVGHAWRHHYDRLHLHTAKKYSHLPHLPFPEDYPTFVPRQLVVDYLEQYTRHFNIRPEFGREATQIVRNGACWEVSCKSGKTFLAEYVVLATGVNHSPHRPAFKGEADFRGQIIHSRAYRNPQPFFGQRVLVVGMGNTGAEIALDLSEQQVDTYLSVRSPVNVVPRTFLNRPTQESALKLAQLPHWLGDRLGALVPRLVFGDLQPYGLRQPSTPPARQLRETGKTPVIDVGTVAQIKAGNIKVRPGIAHFTSGGVVFSDQRRLEVDSVILATGYRPALHGLLPEPDERWGASGLPQSCVGTGSHEGLYFLGFDNYKAGGILGIIRSESLRIAESISACTRSGNGNDK